MSEVFKKIEVSEDDNIVLGTPEINKPVTVLEIYERLCSLSFAVENAANEEERRKAMTNMTLYLTKEYRPR